MTAMQKAMILKAKAYARCGLLVSMKHNAEQIRQALIKDSKRKNNEL